MTVYVGQAEWTRQKGALTRALSSGDPLKVLACVEKTLDEWSGKAWPDAWARWSVAVYDAWLDYERNGGESEEMLARFSDAYYKCVYYKRA